MTEQEKDDLIAELEEKVNQLERAVAILNERLTLTAEEHQTLKGHGDGCVRVRDLYSIAHRFFPPPEPKKPKAEKEPAVEAAQKAAVQAA